MESNLYTRFGKILKIPGTILVVVIFLYHITRTLRESSGLGYQNSEILLMILVGILMYTAIFLVVFFTGKYIYNLGTREDTPLKHIRDWPTTLKVIGIIYLGVIIFFMFYFLALLEPSCFGLENLCSGDAEKKSVIAVIIIPFAFISASILFIAFFIEIYTRKKRRA